MNPPIAEFLFNLSEQGIKLWFDGDRLRCNAPKQVLTPDLQMQLTERKPEILAFLQSLSEPSAAGLDLPAIVPDQNNRHQPFPLNEMQQAYWIGRMDSFDMGNVSIHSYTEIEINDFDLARFSHAWNQLINRHDMLRAVVLPDGQQQILAQVPPYAIQQLDWRDQEAETVRVQSAAIRDRLSHQMLPLEQWPQFEILAARLDETRTRIHISLEGWCLDGRSLQLLFRELKALYEAPTAPMPVLDLSFRDYVLAVIALENSPFYQKSLAYWQRRIPTLPPPPELPLAQNPAALKTPRFVNFKYTLERQALQQLTSRAAQAGLTLACTLLTVYAEVIHLWSKSSRFTLNVPRFNRLPLHPQVNDIMGELASFTLLEVDCSVDEPFTARAKRIQTQLWQDLEHDAVSGVRLLRELAKQQGKASGSAMPIVFTTTPQEITPQALSHQQTVGDIPLGEVVYSVYQTPQVWLDNIYYSDADGSLTYTWQVVADLFPEGMVEDMFDAACRLLQRLASEETAWQDTQQPLIPPAQLEQRFALNSQTIALPNQLLHQLFAAQVARQPQQAAVVTSTHTLTYEALSWRSNQVGHRLRQLGVTPNQLVAVVMEKGWEQIVAVMGILAAGGAYVPIDPTLPQERFLYLLEDSQVNIVLTQSWLEPNLPWTNNVKRLCLDVGGFNAGEFDTGEFAAESTAPLQPVQTLDDLAYVIYTSGSTGLPKGVMITHRNVVNVVVYTNERFQINSGDRILSLTALNHDLSVYDLFGLVSAGGTLVLPNADAVKDPHHWADLMIRHRVTLWNSVPAMMEMWVDAVEPQAASFPNLRLAILGGDWLPVSLPQRLRALVPQIQILSIGGPTETTIWNIGYLIEQVDPDWKSIPYGQPMSNSKYYILNAALENCPTWVPGTMYCAGVQVAKGYWRNQEKTRDRFTLHPRTGEHLYCTGDLGRYLPDGNIEFLGRVDFQIKLRGQRIEAGEIEATLTQHPRVRSAVVTAVGEPSNPQGLAAYVVLDQSIDQSANPSQKPELPKLADRVNPLGGVLLDPVERIEFKLKQLGLQQFQPTQPTVQLPQPERDAALIQAYLQRQSYRQFLDRPLSLTQLGQWLSVLLPITVDGSPLPKYRYASAGGLYPIQAYLFVKPDRIQGLEAGFYYYHPIDHRLAYLNAASEMTSQIYDSKNQPIFEQSAFSLFLIGQLRAIAPMYGELARDFCLLEAGYISQLLMEAATEQAIGLCPIGSLEEGLSKLLSLESSQILLHSFVGGGIEPSWMTQWLQPVPDRQPEAIADQLRHFLQQKLPSHMVPSAYIVLDALPLTSNGKVNRLALPAPDLLPQVRQAYVIPQTESEQLIAGVWREILQLETVGIYDNFFELGGNSLLMVRTQAKLQALLHQDIPIVDLFKSPTIHSLANYLSHNKKTKTSTEQGNERAKLRSDRQAIREQRKQSR
ncbi:MAG: amino acid adenylation domain-containing protein [Drouetiella hepatica Uher 2000/2452]|jgi:amino acid adenylation domain-containing protein|uniref:Amino acid adenylation domain-containing protein n=1 Tax=Drouetiella hepatica Uher 2000/2452 TaxID=904376 RepID=A0A951QF21_9CYAN|nr:amino acid adenylation domain-containing protein [Drouetiella hepatica Uher 2000/2452]